MSSKYDQLLCRHEMLMASWRALVCAWRGLVLIIWDAACVPTRTIQLSTVGDDSSTMSFLE